jgi:hypothetical protein
MNRRGKANIRKTSLISSPNINRIKAVIHKHINIKDKVNIVMLVFIPHHALCAVLPIFFISVSAPFDEFDS